MRWWCRVSLSVFMLVFAAGVTCAVVCPEQTIDPRHDESTCTKCISMHFFGEGKHLGDTLAIVLVIGADLPLMSVRGPISFTPTVPSESPPVFIETHTIRI
jgi:hypothetical protein